MSLGMRYGLGYGYGYGYGYGAGDGYGVNYGVGVGDGYGVGYGYGHGDGNAGLVSATVTSTLVTVDMLIAIDACDDGIEEFKALFPDGARYPQDMQKAKNAGLNTRYVRELGLVFAEDHEVHE